MATLSEADSRRMYSWWWDSHISPKNSKWLQENLTDIDSKVKTMIKLIEEDADSFAKRAEMYYKKRPELMKLVEEFYRAYRALAERYDHATGALRQAHRSMAEAFPNQVPLLMAGDPSTNDISTPVRAFKQLNDLFGPGGRSRFSEGKIRKRLNFDEVVENTGLVSSEAKAKKAESEVETLKRAVTELTEEKETAVVEYQKCLESISCLERNVAFAHEEVERLNGEVDNGVVKLKDAEERCLLLERTNRSLRPELDLLMLKAESQSQELTEKQRELGRLWACIQEERSRYMEAETALKALQNLHSRAQEELRSMASELQNKAQISREMEARNQSLQHELNESNKKHKAILERFDALGFKPECFESSVKKLKDENVNLQENVALLEELLEKNALLENCLIDAHDELEVLKAKSKSLEDSCQILVKQNAGLISENDTLNSQKQRLEDLDKRFMELEEKYLALEKEKDTTLFKVEELKVSLEGQKEEQVSFSKISESRLSGIETRIRLLQEESRQKNQELVEELDKAFLDSQIESFVLRKCVQELEEKKSALLIECRKLVEASELSEKLISELETENLEQQMEVIFHIEEENFALFGEMLSLSYLSLIFKNYVNEKSVEVKEIQEDLKEVQMENLNLKEALQKSEHELITATFFSDQLNYEVTNGKNLLKQKEMELWEARWKLESTENENWELVIQVDDLKSKYDVVNSINKEQMDQIFKLSEDNDRLSKANRCLLEELVQLRRQHEESQNREEKVKDLNVKVNILERENSQLKEQMNRIFKLSEDSNRLSKENRCLLEELVQLREEHEESQNREEKFKDLKVKVNILERENGQLKAQLDLHGPAVISLRDSISSLENHFLSRTILQKFNSEKDKDDELMTHPLAESHQTEDKDAFLGLQDLQNRVEAIERTLLEKEQETVITQTKREDPQQENSKPKSEISEVESRCLTKDIMLDQTSECSSQRISSREAESQMVELWETIDHDSSIDLTVGRSNGKDIEYRQLLSVKTKSRFRHEELNGDELDLSKRLTENRREGSKRKILEKLNSDVQKLTNLQITVQDLKNKVKIIEESKKVKGNVECDSLKVELEEAEVAIEKLFDLNEKLVKSFEEKNKSSKESAESGSVRRRRIQEQARRASEKIGRLQLEIQKIQFVLLKIDDEKETKGRGIVLDSKRRVLLRDYIYGGVRQSPRRKKAPFCGCIQPPTRGE